MPETESQLITAAKKDPKAFGELYDRYAPRVYRYALSRLGNIEEARDITSQTFLKAVEMLPRYSHRGYFSAWLFSIAHNKCIDHFRSLKRELNIVSREIEHAQTDLLEEIVDTERMTQVKEGIQRLTFEDQELLRLRFVANLTFGQIAGVLKKNESAVKKRYYRLLERLQKQMEG